jgi:uncharacterized MAPEG superfamily protein
MSIEMTSLAIAAAMSLALPMIYMPLYQKQIGPAGISGNRENVPEPKGAAGRGVRAHRNLIENLVPFAIAVLIAHVMGISNNITVAGALIFLIARLVHAVTYLTGITGVRSLAYIAGVCGTALVIWQVL